MIAIEFSMNKVDYKNVC